MADISVDDITTLFSGCVISYKGVPHKVLNVSPYKLIKMKNLVTNKIQNIDFNFDDMSHPLPRLGFVNSHCSTAYVLRKPVRRYQAGLTKGNIEIVCLRNNEEAYPEGRDIIIRMIHNMDGSEFTSMLLNEYPTLPEAKHNVKEFGGSQAFDRQFAIDSRFNIYYKEDVVGHLPKNCSTIERIEFTKGNEFLINLIGKNYEKVV